MILSVKLLHEDAVLPTRATVGSVGYDLYALKRVTIPAFTYAKANTGIAVAVPPGTYGRIAPRSGLAARYGIDVLAGVVDPDYTGEILVLLSNFSYGGASVTIEKGDRIAQLILERCETPPVVELAELPGTERGEGCFGSTGS